MILFFLFIGFLLTLGAIISVINSSKAPKLKLEYEAAIKSGDKAAALIAGRKYYAAKNGNGQVRSVDEQAITNDLMAM